MEQRDRAAGWQYAKLSGHRNEDLVTALVLKDQLIQNKLLNCVGKSAPIIKAVDGGLNETTIPSVLGDFTKAKTDLRLLLEDGTHINISIKKSTTGQVFLIQPDRFIEGFQIQYNTTIPENIKRGIFLYFGKAEDTISIVKQHSRKDKIRAYELRKHRLVKDTLDMLDPSICADMLQWFKENIVNIFDFCFIRGLAKNPSDWADVVWYKNLLPNEKDPDHLFDMQKLRQKLWDNRHKVVFGSRTGG